MARFRLVEPREPASAERRRIGAAEQILRNRQRCERHQAKLEAVEQEPGKPGAQDEQSSTHSVTRLRFVPIRTLMMALLSSSP